VGKEIERKFLVKGEQWRKQATGIAYRQGYLSTVVERTVRVRTIGEKGFLTVKGISVGATRTEFEYEIPVKDANTMLNELCERPLIEKIRYKIDHAGLTWEIDEFEGENKGLIIAEIEIDYEEQKIEIPDWIAEEVTGDPKYFNANLIRSPYKSW
jgi:CYTH domain-containing protein